MRTTARAKVTLALDVPKRRDDGWHCVDIVLQRIAWGDAVRIEEAAEPCLAVEGMGMTASPDNLAWRALGAVARVVGEWPSVRMTIHKRVPVGAGLGGGSADAASVLRWAADHYPRHRAAIYDLAASLGKDIPFLLDGEAARATGLGDRLGELPPLAQGALVVAYPGFPVSTPAVYAAYDAVGPSGPPLAAEVVDALRRHVIPSQVGNQLEEAARRVEPRLVAFRHQLEDLGARPAWTTMSGSGSAHVVLCGDSPEARRLARRLRSHGVPWVRVFSLS